MIKSQGWKWEIVKDDENCIWKNPAVQSYYLVNRWKSQGKNDFLDLGCGLGRHSILFAKNDFNTYCFDISEDAVNKTRKWCEEEKLNCQYKIGDMLNLPYEDSSFDCILCMNVISHTDTEGIKKIIKELYRVLKKNGEVYLTLCSKDTWGFKDTDWPKVDENTKLLMVEGPEKGVPHFYADYDLIRELFKKFTIIDITQVENFYEHDDGTWYSYHYHLLIKKD